MTKWKSKLAGMLAAGALAVAMVPAVALGLDADTTISVSGVEATNATVQAYQIVKADQSNTATDGTAGWALNGTYGEIKLADIIGKDATITAAEAATIAANVSGTPITLTDADGDGTYEGTVTAPGVYVVLVEGTGATVYNPMFVSADYDGTNTTNTIAANATYSGTAAVAKSSTPTITKTFTDKKDQAVQAGDKVPFEIGTTVPYYPAPYYTDPTFVITDKIDEGLTYDEDVKVTVGETTLTAGEDYTLSISGQTMTITFSKDYLQTERAASAVKVAYSATVSDPSKFTKNVTEMTNDATIKFTNNPGETKDSDHVKTHHYTFGIDADLTGATQTGKKTQELEKVSVDANGNIEYVKVNESFDKLDPTKYSPLAGAVFQLTGTSTDGVAYDQSFTTDDMGTISFNGLGEGTYTLKETSAPAGYQLDTTAHSVVIDAQFNDDGTLKSYTITIDGTVCSNVSITNDSDGEIQVTDYETKINENQTALLKNVKSGLLPSTGGNGIYFYVIFGAAVAAVSFVGMRVYKKRAAATK